MKRSKPIPRKSKKKRRVANPCSRQRCGVRASVGDLCKTHATKEADRLFSLQVRSVQKCWAENQLFLCAGNLQCCHILTRGYRSLRWDDDNARAMCAAHHVFYTHRPDDWREFVRRRGIDYDALHLRAVSEPPMDVAEVLTQLRKKAA